MKISLFRIVHTPQPLRSPFSGDNNNFCAVNSNGSYNNGYANNTNGVAP